MGVLIQGAVHELSLHHKCTCEHHLYNHPKNNFGSSCVSSIRRLSSATSLTQIFNYYCPAVWIKLHHSGTRSLTGHSVGIYVCCPHLFILQTWTKLLCVFCIKCVPFTTSRYLQVQVVIWAAPGWHVYFPCVLHLARFGTNMAQPDDDSAVYSWKLYLLDVYKLLAWK